ncbi:MAG: hypothetical protein J6T39_01105 [Clostridia bacterium]|nr:hypothetical protein [Clostridia bacterium]
MEKNKTKSLDVSNLLIIVMISLICIFSISLALFSYSENVLKMSGTVPNYTITLMKDGVAHNTNSPIVIAKTESVGNKTISVGFKAESNISVYARAKITYNWKTSNTGEIDYTYGNASDYVTINYVSNNVDTWYQMNGWLYYNASSSSISAINSDDSSTHSIFSSITISNNLPEDVEIYVLIEVVQGNNLGIQKFGTSGTDYPAAWLA